MKRKKIIYVIFAILLFGIGVRFAWIAMIWTSDNKSVLSPDKQYEARVLSKYRTSFWSGVAYDHHEVSIITGNGQNFRSIDLGELAKGWPQDCTIHWSEDSSSVAFVFKSEDSEKTRLIVNVKGGSITN
jgi:hypothetical protein